MPLTLLHGDDPLTRNEALRALRERFNPADIVTYDGSTASLSAMAEASLTAGLFDPERLVIIQDLEERYRGKSKDSEAAAIAEMLQNVAPSTTLMLVSGELSAEHALLRDVKQAGGEIRAFTVPKRQELPRWIEQRAKGHNAVMDRAAAELLGELIGGNPVMLDSEIVKLATYAGSGERITTQVVDLLVGAVPQQSIFALVDAVAAGNRSEALRLLHAQLSASTSTPMDVALYLVRMLARQMRILLRVRLGQEAGSSQPQVIADLKLNRYFADRYFRQARRLSRERLTASFDRLAEFELALKSGQAEPG